MPSKVERPSRDRTLMEVARVFSKRSTCKVKVGAVLVKEGRVISTGYNGSPPGQPHCVDEGCILDNTHRCTRTIHAEINVILMAARYGIPTVGTTLYCTTAPCPNCSKLLTNSGIVKVVYEKVYRDLYTSGESFRILANSNIEVVKYHG